MTWIGLLRFDLNHNLGLTAQPGKSTHMLIDILYPTYCITPTAHSRPLSTGKEYCQMWWAFLLTTAYGIGK